jgi:hypothetical protein
MLMPAPIDPPSHSARPVRIVPAVVMQHIEDVAVLHAQRTVLSDEHVTLSYLRRFDERLAAHLGG